MRGAAFALALALAALAGCADKFGKAVIYRPDNPNPIKVVMSPDAPFIGQEFVGHRADGSLGHLGVDFWTHVGTPVLAAAPGRVSRALFDPVYGWRITIAHGRDQRGRPIITQYMHMSRLDVARGAVVARGQQIGASGMSGALAGFPHLHFEVLATDVNPAGTAEDPHLFWADGVGRVTCFDPARSYPADRFVTTVPLPCRR